MMNRVVIVGRIQGGADLWQDQRKDRLAMLRLRVPRTPDARVPALQPPAEDVVRIVTGRKDLLRLFARDQLDGRLAMIEGSLGQVRTENGVRHAVILNRQGQFRLLGNVAVTDEDMAA